MPLPALSHVSLGTNDYPRARAFYEYTPGYYAAFVRDPDGNKLEAMVRVQGR